MLSLTERPNDTPEVHTDATVFLESLFAQAPKDHFLEIREIDPSEKVRQTFHSIGGLQKNGFGTVLPMEWEVQLEAND